MHPFVAEALLAMFSIVEGVRLLNVHARLPITHKPLSWRASFAGVAIQKDNFSGQKQPLDGHAPSALAMTIGYRLFKRLDLGVILLGTSALIALMIHLFVDTRYLCVMLHNHPAQAWYYRLASLWSHHETSLFVWLCVINGVSHCLSLPADVARFRRRVLAFINVCLGVYLCMEANPFASTPLSQLNQESHGLNPLLVDLNVVWHPPLLYLGQAWLFTPYVLALYGAVKREVEPPAKDISHHIKLGCGILTAAIALGSLWAFTQLGWGGFWFWDPVETASLLPWLAAVIVFHVPQHTHKKLSWLAGIPFVCVCISLWVIRSGILVSVHSFSQDAMAFWLLGAFAVFVTLLLGISALKKNLHPYHPLSFSGLTRGSIKAIKQIVQCDDHPLNTNLVDAESLKILGSSPRMTQRDKWLSISLPKFDQKHPHLLNSGLLLLCGTFLLLCVGLFAPLIVKVTLSPPFFNKTLLPLWAGVALLMALAPKRQARISSSCTCALLAVFVYVIFYRYLSASSLLLGACGTICAGAMLPLLRQRARMALAHMGVGLCLIGLASYSNSPPEATFTLAHGVPFVHESYAITFVDTVRENGDFISKRKARIHVKSMHTHEVLELLPAKQYFHASQRQRAKADFGVFDKRFFLITSIEPLTKDTIAITFHEKHGLLWLCFGVVLMVLGMLISYRVMISKIFGRTRSLSRRGIK